MVICIVLKLILDFCNEFLIRRAHFAALKKSDKLPSWPGGCFRDPVQGCRGYPPIDATFPAEIPEAPTYFNIKLGNEGRMPSSVLPLGPGNFPKAARTINELHTNSYHARAGKYS